VPIISESERIGRAAIDKKLEVLAVKIISSLGHIGKTGAERELMLATNLAVKQQ